MDAQKVTIVTGAGSGIGRATAVLLAKAGHQVVVADKMMAPAEAVAREICSSGGTAVALGVDVASESDVASMVEQTVKRFGRLDCAFNNAGVQMHSKLIEELDSSEWKNVIDINLTSVFYCMKYEIQAMRRFGGGAIVNTASGNAVVGSPHSAEYVAAKHGVLGITRAGSCETRYTGVRVNAVIPGIILTPMMDTIVQNPDFSPIFEAAKERTGMGRFGQPEEIAEVVLWLLSDQASFVNGAGIAADGGYTAR